MEKISNILNRKHARLHSVSPETTADKALKQMCCENVEFLVVMDENEKFVGLITERDISARILTTIRELSSLKVRELINTKTPHAELDDTLETCIQLMSRHKVRHIPVFDDLVFTGVISSDDILDEAVSHRGEIFDEQVS